MSDSAQATVTVERLPEPILSATGETSFAASASKVALGEIWGEYLIEQEWPAGGPGAFIAQHVGSTQKVMVRAFPIVEATEWRRGAWDRLAAMPTLQAVRCISAEEESGWRYEVSAVPPPTTLREWTACHRPKVEEIEAFVRQLGTTLSALHAQGVVHLNLRPDAIHIDESGPEPLYVLAGLHQATLYTQADLKPANVDPFYAPPEAAGIVKHLPGTRLCAWDWWSIGRVVQEFSIGRHVLGLVLDRDVSRVTPELRAKAELLLLEREPAGAKAGALEFMRADPATTPLLRGLLTGSLEGRWGFDAVQRWLRHEPVQDHYDLPRNARMWVTKGRTFTMAEAAEHFCKAENWDEGEDTLFNEAKPETLAAFLRASAAHREDLDRLVAACDVAESSEWGNVSDVARRTVTAALAWLSLANGSGVRTPFRVRGHSMDVSGLTELLRSSGPSTGVAIFTALLSPVVIACVEKSDATAARVLTAASAKGLEAIKHGAENGWLDLNDQAGHARIFELALKAGALLREKIDLLRSLYATNSNGALAAVFAAKVPTPRDVVILAFTAEAPPRYGYKSHEEWRVEQYEALKVEADGCRRALYWVQLGRFLDSTRMWGLPTPTYSAGVLVLIGLVALLGRAVEPAAIVGVVLLGSRVYFTRRVDGMTRIFDASASPWVWPDGAGRCAKEVARVLAAYPNWHAAELGRELTRLRTAMDQRTKPTDRNVAPVEPKWWDLWSAFGGAVFVTFAVFALLLARHPPSVTPHKPVQIPAHQADVSSPDRGASKPVATIGFAHHEPSEVEALVATGRYEVVDDGFGRQLRGPLKRWTLFATGVAAPPDVTDHATASSEQSALALVSGTVLLQPYARKGLNVFLALRVPTTRGFGVMIFNGHDRQLVDQTVLLVREPLVDQTWYRLAGRNVVFLEAPAALQSEISLAPH
ncbi:MAG: serine/threonine-protein kinase [Opitutus sp.]